MREFESTLEYLPPMIVENPNDWHNWDPLYGFELCATVPSASDLPGAKITAQLISYDSKADVSSTIILTPDTEKPTLNTSSTPRKGTKVKAGDTIKVRMEASEEYTSTRSGWQTGVKRIQLIDEGPNPVVVPRWEGIGMRACSAKQWKQFLEVTYTVPANPPPVIRLRAIAEDFAGNKDEDVAEFPTTDVWSGTTTVTSTVVYPGPDMATCRDSWDLKFNFVVGAQGTISGSGTGDLASPPDCSFGPGMASQSIQHAEISVLGEKTASGFSLRFALVNWGPAGRATVAGLASVFGGGRIPTGGQAAVSIAVVGKSGSGQGTWQIQSGNPPATYSANGAVTVVCPTCDVR